MTSRATARGKQDRRPRRRLRTGVLVVVAVLIAAAFMVTRTAQAIVSSTPCRARPVLLNVAVSPDLAPSVRRVAQLFNLQRHPIGASCAQAMVLPGASAVEAARIDGQQPGRAGPRVDAWIPDSSLWVDVARSFPVGAQAIRPTGVTVARSPLMIVMPAAAAAAIPAFGPAVSWNFLLPQSVGGPSSGFGLRVQLPDPAQSAVGLATLVQMGRLLGSGQRARTAFTKFVFNSEVTGDFDGPTELAEFVDLAAPPLNGHPVTVTSEQAVVGYDQAHPGRPLAARYPVGASARLGTPELDYPFVLITSDPREQQAAQLFAAALRQPYAAGVVRYYGFRSASGVADAFPASDGLSRQVLQLAPPATPSKAQSVLQIWAKLGIGSRDLSLVDVSSAMSRPSSIPGLTLEQELAQAAGLGLALFPDSTDMGLWEMASKLSAGQPYRQLVSVGPLTGEVGLISRRAQLLQVNRMLQPRPDSLALHSAILAAYAHMVGSYQPGDANAVLVLTSGVDSAPGDLSLHGLLTRLRMLVSSSRPVAIVAIMFGSAGDFPALRQIAAVTGGTAYQISRPGQISTVFFKAVARRLCDPSCAAP